MEKITRESLRTGFKVLIRYLGIYKREVIILSIMGIISAVGNGVIPYIAGKFFDAILDTETILPILGYGLPLFGAILALWAVVQLVTAYLDWRLNIRSEVLSNKVWVDYVAGGFSHIWELPMSFHKKEKIGEIGQKVNSAGGSLETVLGRIIIDLSPQLLSIIIALGIGFYINATLTWVIIVGVILFIGILIRSVRPAAKIQKEYYDTMMSMWGDMFDTINNTQTIKQAVTEDYEKDKLTHTYKHGLAIGWIKMVKIWANLNFAQRIIILGTQITIFILSIFLIRNGTITIGDLLAFNAYATMVFGPFVTLGRNWQSIQNCIIELHVAEKILTTPKEIYAPVNAPKLGKIKGDIIFDQVFFGYSENQNILHDINIHINGGEVIALVGESGVGKSTLIDLISGYHFPTKGKVTIDGYGVETLNLKELRSQIAVVPQEVVLFNDTIINNIRYGNFQASDSEVEEAAKKAHAYDFIQKFPDQWQQKVGERGIKLSVGQKQRVSIARAILRNPRILILDEPTSALDAGSEKIITAALEELMRGKTTFIIAHRLSTVRKANKIIVFKEGKITESGTHDELLKNEGGEYKRLYELQIGLHE